MNFLNRPHFRFHGDIEEAKMLYMQAWRYLQNMKQFTSPGLGIQGPFRKIFDDGTEFLVQCVFGQDFVNVYVPELRYIERGLQEGQRFFQPILVINVYETGLDTYTSEYVDEETWIRYTDNQARAAEAFDKDIEELSSLYTEHPYILNINSALYNEEDSKKDIAKALASPVSYGLWCATIGYDPDVPFPANDQYEDVREITEIYNNTLPHPELGTSWLIMTGLEDLQEIFNTFNEKIKEDVRPGAYGTITLPTIVVMNLQEYARRHNSDYASGWHVAPVDDEVPLFVEWFKEQPGSGDIFVNHWFTAKHTLSDIPYTRDAWCDPLMPYYEVGCDRILDEPAGGQEDFHVHIKEYRQSGQAVADVTGGSDISDPEFASPWWGRWISWISRTVMFHCKIDEEAFNISSKEIYHVQEHFSLKQGCDSDSTGYYWDEEHNIEKVVWTGISWIDRDCRYSYVDMDFTAHPLLQEKNQYINRWNLLGKTEWTRDQQYEDAQVNGLSGVWSLHTEVYSLESEVDTGRLEKYPVYNGYEGTPDDPSIIAHCPGEEECPCVWVVIDETPWRDFLEISAFDTFWDDSGHRFTQAVHQYD